MSQALASYRRRQFDLDPARGSGQVAGLEWGPATGRHDILFLHANGFNAMTDKGRAFFHLDAKAQDKAKAGTGH